MSKVLKANLYFLIILLLEIFIPSVLAIFYLIAGIEDIRVMLFINHMVLFLVPAAIYIKVTKSSAKNVLKLNKLYLKDAVLIILLAFVCQPIMSFLSVVTSFFFNNEIGTFIAEINSTPYLILLSLVAILPSITEEVTIRGVVLSGYQNKNKYVAALVTGVFFGILHLDPQQFLYATVLGIILALLVRITNSIFSAALLHFIINGTSVTLSKLLYSSESTTQLVNDTSEMTLKYLGLNEKITLFFMYGIIALIFSTFVYVIIGKLEEWNIKRGVLLEDNGESSQICELRNDKIINWPFILIIIIYIIFIVLKLA